eukprot:3951057-Alexandrium_andersonii.AAC.1
MRSAAAGIIFCLVLSLPQQRSPHQLGAQPSAAAGRPVRARSTEREDLPCASFAVWGGWREHLQRGLNL